MITFPGTLRIHELKGLFVGCYARHCGILYIKNDCTFKLDPVKLRTVRPLILDSVCLSDTGIHPQNNDKVESYLTEKVTELIKKAKRDSSNEKLPLVRLKVS